MLDATQSAISEYKGMLREANHKLIKISNLIDTESKHYGGLNNLKTKVKEIIEDNSMSKSGGDV